MAIALNVARRQLNAEDRQELVVKLRAEGQSTRQIAAALGVDPKTVRNDLNDAAEATGENSPVDRVTGKDGKSRPARMPAKAKKAAPATKAEPKALTEAPQAPEPAKVTPTEPEVTPATEAVAKEGDEAWNRIVGQLTANEPSGSTPADVLLDTFHKLTPAEQVTTMQLFWDVLADSQKQQLREHVTAELPTGKLLTDRWPSMADRDKQDVHLFIAAALAKFETVKKPAAPAAQNGAATGIATS
jgi:hypothetical protein